MILLLSYLFSTDQPDWGLLLDHELADPSLQARLRYV